MSEETTTRVTDVFAVSRAWLSVPVAVVLAGAVLGFAPLSTDATRMLAITLFCVVLWVGSPVRPWFTALLCIGLVGVTFSPSLALTGFQLPATWLVVVGILVGEATRESGLASLVERLAVRWMPAGVASDARSAYRYLLVVTSFGGLAFAVLVPSSLVRVLVLAPILHSLGGLFSDSRARVGLLLGPLFATFYGASGILTGSLANIIVTGLLEASGGPAITWTEWAVWLAPVMGVGRVVVVVAVALALYRPADGATVDVETPDRADAVSLTSTQRRMALFLLVGVVVWATDFLHGLHPLFGAVVVALLAFAPRIGVVGPEAVERANFSILFFLGAIFAIAEGLRRVGFTELAANALLDSVPSDPSLALVLAFVVAVSLALTFVMEGLAVASVLTPILVAFAESVGVSVVPVAMMEAVALNAYFFPYQSAVLVAILGLDVVDAAELTRMASACSIATLALLVPIQIALFSLLF
ncbi:SLC13 family permease [Halogeometricum limi]|uniref:Di-and tricarboxylate transporter n=1 Tax=Halogeometricum limi TaxID=555875 RepID=A0A1I6IBF2_9EURY|nr:SLC13 family permease [Halogeometricum limi]SFR63710.1 Di-and tricarboxylate transporter [Halogeometricum limi]